MRLTVCALVWAAALGSALGSNSVVNLSHYDLMRVDFQRMRLEGIVGVIHEATYPPYVRDDKYASRQRDAAAAGMLWGAYHYGNARDPVRQADHFLSTVASTWGGSADSPGVLLVLDFEKNRHYPGGTMQVAEAVRFVERIRERTGRYPGIYSGENLLRANMSRATAAQRAVLGRCWLWIANYHNEPGPIDPFGQWALWQYTGDGVCDLRPRAAFPVRVSNIGRAERNMFRGSTETVRSFWQAHAWAPGG